MKRTNVAIIVGGGPAPGINGVISAATIEAINRGHTVFGVRRGFERVGAGDASALEELKLSDVSFIHSRGGSVLFTSRANPRKSPEMLQNVVSTLTDAGVGYLVTIGGDDTASSAMAVSEQVARSGGTLRIAHVPKTIDNDLPLPGKDSTFGYQTARAVGTEIVETLMEDAKTTNNRWYLVIAMGRKAGHLALGIGMSSGATLSLIPEEFSNERKLINGKLPLKSLVDTVVGSMLKRLVVGKPYGVVVLAEGLASLLDLESIPELSGAERDPHGHIRYAEVDFGGLLRRSVRARLKQLGISDVMVVDKNVGYELRCRPPDSFDREYTRMLGYGVIDFLLSGGSDAMITRQGDRLKPIPFSEFVDGNSGRSRVRLVDTTSEVYQVARKYMIRLTEADFKSKELFRQMRAFTNLSAEQLKEELLHLMQ